VSESGVDGLQVPVRDARALADAIRQLDDDRALARTLGLAARDKALKNFDERIVIEKTLAVYRELVPSIAIEGERREHAAPVGNLGDFHV
jgi:glycosyltransferase involved in cell wall biosynthesis